MLIVAGGTQLIHLTLTQCLQLTATPSMWILVSIKRCFPRRSETNEA